MDSTQLGDLVKKLFELYSEVEGVNLNGIKSYDKYSAIISEMECCRQALKDNGYDIEKLWGISESIDFIRFRL